MKIAVTGGTGLVGTRLITRLQAQGDDCLLLTRDPVKATAQFPRVEVVAYTPQTSGAWQQAIAGCDAVINLAGEPLAQGRWTPARKQEILNSRQVGTAKLVEAIAQANPRPPVLISTSAIGYYGTSETATFTETSPAGQDFLASVCQAWEMEAAKVSALGTRLVILRFGIVLGLGGALGQMLPTFKLFAGGPIGSGRQWFSWIHQDDLVNIMLQALQDGQMAGIYNATAPTPQRMTDFCQTLGQVMGRPSWLPVPDFVLELLLGEAAQVVLEGQQVLPQRLQAVGFRFKFPDAQAALADILKEDA
ncbi:TIGR01777 family oxidoreductase [Thermosynechococcaceae cyanobacterium BACA0444]|uniref:TIGR01777 family oxidoreductase n=1 Tax=Pseudocalidococcus azoricus BACA0444 TaxID=2918990 RepID=A0AAE4FU04_9CYAN|nr:TIGR01777 family oxidoreductase [Pseudocalidococcus azoricus]MDS3861354.1 TIGR01777 family oxidoreductase [Pseudocalidococcus azoricus BACA0444]